MPRSKGTRPKKAVRDQVLALKARLSELNTTQWAVAQCVFDQITSLCGVRGPCHGKMVPRACRRCGYYGHTRTKCPREVFSLVDLRSEWGHWREPTKEDSTEEEWKLWLRQRRHDKELQRMVESGMGCENGSGTLWKGACEACSDCEAWRVHWAAFVGSDREREERGEFEEEGEGEEECAASGVGSPVCT